MKFFQFLMICLHLKWKESKTLILDLPRVYQGGVEGLCGNFNCEKSDDWNLKGGEACENPADYVARELFLIYTKEINLSAEF